MEFLALVKRNVGLVAIPDEWKEKFLAKVELWENEANDTRQKHIDRLKSALTALKARIDRINTAYTEGGLELREFKNSKTRSSPKRRI